jgi:predicted PurR-regulated permease PerM
MAYEVSTPIPVFQDVAADTGTAVGTAAKNAVSGALNLVWSVVRPLIPLVAVVGGSYLAYKNRNKIKGYYYNQRAKSADRKEIRAERKAEKRMMLGDLYGSW